MKAYKPYYVTIFSSTERDKKGLDVNWLYGIYNSEEEAKKNWKANKPEFEFIPSIIKIRADKEFSSDEVFFEEFMQKFLPEQYEKEKISKMSAYERGMYFAKKSIKKHSVMLKGLNNLTGINQKHIEGVKKGR